MAAPSATAKQEVPRLLEGLPEDGTMQGIQYQLYVLEKIRPSRADIVAGRVSSTEQAKERLGKWLQR